MFRCVRSRLLVAAGLLCAATVQAQATLDTGRKFPATALRGEMVFGTPPQVTLNGEPAQLAPGARIRDAQDLQRLTGEVTGLKATVHYTVDLMGQPLQVWLLNAAERAKRPWPTTAAQAQAWHFDFDTQTWSQ